MNFAQWLKHRLEEKQMSQAELAHQAHVTDRSVRNWIAGRTQPKGAQLHLVELALKAEYKEEVQDGQVEEKVRPARGT